LIDRLIDAESTSLSSQSVYQCVKALCTMLSHVQPDALLDAVDEYCKAADAHIAGGDDQGAQL